MQGKMHRIRSLTPLPARVGPGWQAAGNALAMHVQNLQAKNQYLCKSHVNPCPKLFGHRADFSFAFIRAIRG
jgi:hypothetical protein